MPEAAGPGFAGQLSYRAPGGSSASFSYRIVRVWEIPVEALLNGELATLPLAPIADALTEQLPCEIPPTRRKPPPPKPQRRADGRHPR